MTLDGGCNVAKTADVCKEEYGLILTIRLPMNAVIE